MSLTKGDPASISTDTLPLPTGAATSANQTTANTSLASIDAGIPVGLGQTTMSNSMPIALASDQTSLSDITASGTLSANNETVNLNTFGRSCVTAVITGTWNMFIIFQGSVDGVTFVNINGHIVSGNDAKVLATVNGTYLIPCAGYKVTRVIASFYTSGTASVALNSSVAIFNPNQYSLIRSSNPSSIGNPVQFTDQSFQIPGLNRYGLTQTTAQAAVSSDWGKSFSVSTNILTAGGTLERDYLLIRNPSASGIVMRIKSMFFSPPQAGDINYRIYSAPTITANGTLLTPVGGRQSGQTAAVGTFYTLPTISARGNIFFAIRSQNTSSGSQIFPEFSLLLDSGFSYLVTVEQSAAGASGAVSLQYSEHIA